MKCVISRIYRNYQLSFITTRHVALFRERKKKRKRFTNRALIRSRQIAKKRNVQRDGYWIHFWVESSFTYFNKNRKRVFCFFIPYGIKSIYFVHYSVAYVFVICDFVWSSEWILYAIRMWKIKYQRFDRSLTKYLIYLFLFGTGWKYTYKKRIAFPD